MSELQTHFSAFSAAGSADREHMLKTVGVSSVEELFASVPESLRAPELNLAPGLSELEAMRHVRRLAGRNATGLVNFCGAGFYDHYIPAAVDSLSGRGEFFTAYTPYQPEASQGTLQAIFEYQSAIARLTAMEASNASLYDGGTALFEAAMMALRITRRGRLLVCEGVNPIYRVMLRSYTRNLKIEYHEIPLCEGRTNREAFQAAINKETAAILLQTPNFFGGIEDLSDLSERAHQAGALSIIGAYPVALALLRPPGEMGADIVTGEGQSLGLPLSFGGPYLGYMATRKKYARQLPGRIVGATQDAQGRRGYVLTLQAREQHIRRQKATSNICTNQSLCALRAVIHLSLLGREGFRQVARVCAARAGYAHERLTAIPGVEPAFAGLPYFNEFALRLPIDAAEVVSRLIDKGLAAGFPVGRYYPGMEKVLLLSFTEKRTREEIDILAARLSAVVGSY